ncbi:stalk domain-containing protein [Anaerobacillus sp. MEB173]|uniref:stalk domain-containing protein n=1 Tax=Anaerobacillus sp. MEB173 TaxID=3383345 RepID=UPI003F939EC9
MKKIILFTVALLIAFSAGTMASSGVNLFVNGSKITNVEAKIENGVTYVPLRAVSEMLGAKVNWDQKTRTVTITGESSSGGTATPPSNSNLSQTVNGVTIKIDKIEQDNDSLRLYVTYTNNSSKEIMTGDSLAKIVANGKQYAYDIDFNFDRYYETGVDHAQDFIEPGVTEKSVIFFKPVNADTINIVLNAHFEDYRYNNVKIK